MNHVDLCSGIGGFALGFQWAGLSKPVMFCDVEPWCRKVLAKHWLDVPVEEDVKVLANEPERIPDCTILTAGYPCQPFSLAGERRGAEDDRHIWPYINEIVAQKRPTWCVFENVYGHLSMGLDEVLSDLETQGYTARPFIVPACGVDAPHKRDRIWIIARLVEDATSSQRTAGAKESGAFSEGDADRREPDHVGGSGEDVAYTASKRQQGSWLHGRSEHQAQNKDGQADRADNSSQRDTQFWLPEPPVGRVANGIPNRAHRLRALGNAVVPQVVEEIGKAIMYAHQQILQNPSPLDCAH